MGGELAFSFQLSAISLQLSAFSRQVQLLVSAFETEDHYAEFSGA
jgi:hypothetical protein